MKLSDLQKYILLKIAENTIHGMECLHLQEQDLILTPHHHDLFGDQTITYSKLKEKALQYWTDGADRYTSEVAKQNKSRAVSFSRSLRSLYKKGLVDALVLAWHIIDVDHEDRLCWQGSGRKEINNHGYKSKTPTFRQLGLTDLGWQVVRMVNDNPDLGKCKHVKEYEDNT